MALVFELGLNKPVPKETPVAQVVPCLKEKFSKPLTPRTMEERRTVLGCFLITSMYVRYSIHLGNTRSLLLEYHRSYRKLMLSAGHRTWMSAFKC